MPCCSSWSRQTPARHGPASSESLVSITPSGKPGGDGGNGVHNEGTKTTKTNEEWLWLCSSGLENVYLRSLLFSPFLRCESVVFVTSARDVLDSWRST